MAVVLTVRSVTGGVSVHEGVSPADTTVEAFKATVAAATGGDAALLRLALGDVPLDDPFRSLDRYGIVADAELVLAPQTAEEGEARRAAAFRGVLSAGAAESISQRLRLIGAVRLKLRHADGSHKHRRWFTWSIAADGSLRVAWGKNRDGSDHFAWKRLSFAAPKQRTVTGVRGESASSNVLGFTLEVAEGEPVVVVPQNTWEMEGPRTRKFCLDLVAAVHGPSRVSALSDGAALSLLGCGCRSFRDVQALAAARIEGLPEAEEIKAALALHRSIDGQVHRYTGQPFGETGVLCGIGTQGNTAPWRNPAEAGDVTVRWSSVYGGCAVSMFVNRPPANPHIVATNSVGGSWMAVDLGAQRQLTLQHYALRNSGEAGGGYALRNWLLEGSQSFDGPWTTLRTHRNDSTLPTRGHAEAAWPIEGNRGAFRCFRVRATGRDAMGSNYMCCGGIELYGTLNLGPGR